MKIFFFELNEDDKEYVFDQHQTNTSFDYEDGDVFSIFDE
jgi:hypothetical protein